MDKYTFNFNENTDYDVLNGRESIYLDFNFWIEIEDAKSANSEVLRDLLKILVEKKKIFCPLHFATISELKALNFESMTSMGQLMDELSLGFIYVDGKTIWQTEVLIFVYSFLSEKQLVIPNNRLFGPFLSYLSQSFSLTYSPEDIEMRDKKNELLCKTIMNFKLSDMIDLAQGFEGQLRKDYTETIRKENQRIWNYAKGNKNIIRRENEDYIAKTKILPTLFKINKTLSVEQLTRFMKYLDFFPTDKKERRIKSILNFLPSLRNEVEIMTASMYDNNRKARMNDFYDLEQLIIPIAYANVFCARDKWIRHLIKITNLAVINNCKYFYSVNELTEYLTKKYLTKKYLT